MATKNPLSIISVENAPPQNPVQPSGRTRRQEVQAHFEREWHHNPKQFDTQRNAKERKRIDDTMRVIGECVDLKNCQICDLGVGDGELAIRLAEKGAKVTAVDVAKNALQAIEKKEIPGVTLHHGCVPYTSLPDDHFDLVIASNLIAHLPSRDYRLFFSEVARLVKKEGTVVCGTPLDIDSIDALERFASLAETELTIEGWHFSYHNTYLRLRRLLKKIGLSKRFDQWAWPLFALEKLNRTFFCEQNISHAILIGKRKPLELPKD